MIQIFLSLVLLYFVNGQSQLVLPPEAGFPTPQHNASGRVTFDYPELGKLATPNPRKCLERILHVRSPVGVNYYLSWMDRKLELSWIGARNFCREMCMDLVSMETPEENCWIKNIIERMKIDGAWTSGRMCDFKGCEYHRSPHMWPREENGWFWASTNIRIAPCHDVEKTDWAQPGPFKNKRQPDNRAKETTGKHEACIAILNNKYFDGIHWHDELCELPKPFICEENQTMLDAVKGIGGIP